MLTEQDHGSYTDEDREVWATLFDRQLALLPGRVTDEFWRCLHDLELSADEIPRLDTFSDRLEAKSGWRVQAVEGQLPGRDYWGLIGSRRFPSITGMRGLHELDHAALPDMFHDLFGHIPLLLDPTYSRFLERMAAIALRHVDDDARLKRHGRVYKWTIEYGLIAGAGGERVYGAGLISSSKEVEHSLSATPDKLPFGVERTMATPHVPASLQPHYFVIESFDQLVDSLPAVERALSEEPQPVA